MLVGTDAHSLFGGTDMSIPDCTIVKTIIPGAVCYL